MSKARRDQGTAGPSRDTPLSGPALRGDPPTGRGRPSAAATPPAAGVGPGRYLKERGRPAAVGEQDVVGLGARLQRQEAAAEADTGTGTQTAQREALAQRRHLGERPPLARLGRGVTRRGVEWRKQPRPFGSFRAPRNVPRDGETSCRDLLRSVVCPSSATPGLPVP